MIQFLFGQLAVFLGICLWAVAADGTLGNAYFRSAHWMMGLLSGVVLVSGWGAAALVHQVSPRLVFDVGGGKAVRRFLVGATSGVLGMGILSVLLVYLDQFIFDAVLVCASMMVSTLFVVSMFCKRRLPGACLQCGYDIRASLGFGRCPECGSGI